MKPVMKHVTFKTVELYEQIIRHIHMSLYKIYHWFRTYLSFGKKLMVSLISFTKENKSKVSYSMKYEKKSNREHALKYLY